jgi:hypothetical protein
MPERVEIIGPATERYVEILSPRALELLVRLHDALADRRDWSTGGWRSPARPTGK